ncbi:MAG TPA: DUF2330 domain-containing protein [Abditibacteriaceae bacterium]|jgi:hypothetical protein|nr:DUF2330 domain-containing protein [Abditibacteriaceae bacterium]
MKRSSSVAVLGAVISCVVSSFVLPQKAQACASLPEDDGSQAGVPYPVEVANEEAVIVWDAKHKTQHFIRRAEFSTQAKNIGFLVPTPTTPQLGEVDNNAFTNLRSWMQPKVAASATKGIATAASLPKSVTVVQQSRVAGYDATVLSANNITSLNRWLKQHHYNSTPELMKWIQPYVKRGWKITAFKVARENNAKQGVSYRAVRMSFQTERPFYPYREPSQARSQNSRLLRVYLFAPKRMTGAINGKLWVGKTVWSDTSPAAQLPVLTRQLGLSGRTLDNMRLTVLEDSSTVRYAPDDVYFQPAFDQARLVPVVASQSSDKQGPQPAGVLLILACGGSAAFFVMRKRSSNRRHSAPGA